MGTRSLTHIVEDGETLVTIYRQMDGYPDVHGNDLAGILQNHKLVNGYGMDDTEETSFNGMGDLAAQVVRHLKDDIGSVYLQPPNAEDCEQYTYTITGVDEVIHLKCATHDKVLFNGPVDKFDAAAATDSDN